MFDCGFEYLFPFDSAMIEYIFYTDNEKAFVRPQILSRIISGGKEKTAINLGIIGSSGVYFNNTFLEVFAFCSEPQLIKVTTKYITLELEKI